MTNFFPVFISYLCLSLGYQMYRTPPEVVKSAPFISLLIFLTALLLLLINLEFYPCSMRSLGWFGTLIFEFLVSYFLMENLMIDFWFPLDEAVSQLPSKFADVLEEIFTCETVCCCCMFRTNGIKVAASYMMSGMLLIMVLHATRLIDLSKLEQGPRCFFDDIRQRFKCSLCKILQGLGLCPEKRVIIIESCGNRGQTHDPCNVNTNTNSSSSRMGGNEDFDINYRQTRRRTRRKCK